jgi:hypothetical protein
MRVFRILAIAVALATAFCGFARAADWYTGVPTDGPPESKPPRATIDIALDGTSQQALSGALIGTIAPFAPMDRSGMRVRGSVLGGSYFYNAGAPVFGRVHGTLINGSFLVGYEWVTSRATVALYAGVEAVNTSISPNDPSNTVKGGRAGVKLATDFYVLPTDNMMLAGVASYSSNFNSYYGRLKFGFSIGDRIYIGPEVAALGDNFFQQWRVGGHLSGLRYGMMQFGAAVGFLSDRVRGGGVYGTLDTRITF